MKFLIFSFLLILSQMTLAALPKASLILTKVAENNGSGVYQIEQEVQFPNGSDILTLKEIWIVQSDDSMKLIVTGMKELKDQFFFGVNYSGGTRTQGSSSRRLNEDFIEKYFHIRKPESFAQALNQMKIVPANVMGKRALRSLKSVDNNPEPFLHLSRTGGVVSYMFGQASVDSALNPGFWFEQDQFVLRKFRLPSQAEVSADRYSTYPRGFNFPRTRTVRWENNQVTIQTVAVSPKPSDAFGKFSTAGVQKIESLKTQAAAEIVEDFYRRFR
jgi:hypothetical protein